MACDGWARLVCSASASSYQVHTLQFYAMVNFCNPGVLGSPAQFRKHYENPILASREPGVSDEIVKRGEERSEELSGIVNDFILRRTNKLLSKFQPPKVRYQPWSRSLHDAECRQARNAGVQAWVVFTLWWRIRSLWRWSAAR
jgi:SNF2-related domain